MQCAEANKTGITAFQLTFRQLLPATFTSLYSSMPGIGKKLEAHGRQSDSIPMTGHPPTVTREKTEIKREGERPTIGKVCHN